MTKGRAAGWLTAALVMSLGLVVMAEDHGRHRRHDADLDDIAREVRHVVRDVTREVRASMREALRDARWALRDVAREVRREVHREVHRSHEYQGRGSRRVSPTDDPCRYDRNDNGRGHACEVRDSRLPVPVGPLTVDASPNGGIRVEAWDQPDVLVRAVIQTWGDDDAEAKALLPRIRVTAAGTRVTAEGPSSERRRDEGWSVSFRIWAPQQTALALEAQNGGISVRGMRSDVRLTTINGGVSLDGVGGHIVGETSNGGLAVTLDGSTWDGQGLDLRTSNGGVSLSLPERYSAELETGTVNGGFRSDYPLPNQDQDRRTRRVRATLGSGGPPVKVTTTNGGVKISRR